MPSPFEKGSRRRLSAAVRRVALPTAVVTLLAVVALLGQGAGTRSVVAQQVTPVPVVGQPILTAISPSSGSVQANQSASFTLTGTTQNTGQVITNFVVDFGDGSAQVSVTPMIFATNTGNTTGSNGLAATATVTTTHTFTRAGTFVVQVAAFDSSTARGQAAAQVTVTAAVQPLSVNLTCASTAVAVGQPVNCTVNATTANVGASISRSTCSFGDGNSVAGPSLSRTFTSAGPQTLTCNATDTAGGSGSATVTIQVTAAPTPSPTPAPTATPAAQAGVQVTFPAGWSIVAGPTGTVITGNDGPLYTYQAGDNTYQIIPAGTPLVAGQGYWAHFSQQMAVTIPLTGPQSVTATLPAGHYVMLGNAGNTTATISGADYVVTFDPASNTYVATTTIDAGHGAWAYSAAGATVTVSNAR